MNKENDYQWDWTSVFSKSKKDKKVKKVRRAMTSQRRYDDLTTIGYFRQHPYTVNESSVSAVVTEAKEQDKSTKLDISVTQCKEYFYSVRTKAQGSIAKLYADPTGNCQIQCMSTFCNILALPREEAMKVIAYTWNNSMRKTLLLVDIPKSSMACMKNIFIDSEIVVEAPYVNNTKSNMCLYLVQIEQMLNRESLIIADSSKLQTVIYE